MNIIYYSKNNSGFTLIELIVVILIIGLITTVSITQFGFIDQFQSKSELNKFIGLWQSLIQESRLKNKNYRLIVNLKEQSYHILEEIPRLPNSIRDVDTLKNFRIIKEDKKLSEEQAYEELEKIDSLPINQQFYMKLFLDTSNEGNFIRPEDFPSLGSINFFPDNLTLEEVQTANQNFGTDEVILRFSGRSGSDLAQLIFNTGDSTLSVFINPFDQKITIREGKQPFDFISVEKDKRINNR